MSFVAVIVPCDVVKLTVIVLCENSGRIWEGERESKINKKTEGESEREREREREQR